MSPKLPRLFHLHLFLTQMRFMSDHEVVKIWTSPRAVAVRAREAGRILSLLQFFIEIHEIYIAERRAYMFAGSNVALFVQLQHSSLVHALVKQREGCVCMHACVYV